MKNYIGTKQVKAQPMTAEEAVKMGYRVGNHKNEDGYEVEYEDGYKSWSPKNVFERSYRCSETALDRMKIEEIELGKKIGLLNDFIVNIKSNDLNISNVSRALLIAQRNTMSTYLSILYDRDTLMESGKGGSCGNSFAVAIEWLRHGFAVRRDGWNGKGLFVVKQVPCHIESDVIPKMQSLPQSAKDKIMSKNRFINYANQCLIYNENTGVADSWVASISDIFAEDWGIVQ